MDQSTYRAVDVYASSAKADLPKETRLDLSSYDLVIPAIFTTPSVFWPLPADANRDALVRDLSAGLANVLACAPVMGSHFSVKDGKTQAVCYNHEPFPLGVRHLDREGDDAFPSLEAFAAAGYPPELINEKRSVLLPTGTKANGVNREDGTPLMAAQITFIKGGVAVTAACNHMIYDAASIDLFLTNWMASAKAAHDGTAMPVFAPDGDTSYFSWPSELPPEADLEGYRSRLKGFKFRPPVEQTTRSTTSSAEKPRPVATQVWHVPQASLQRLKAACKPTDPNDFVSSFDCVSGMMWQAMVRARVPRIIGGPVTDEETAFDFPVNLRGRYPQVVPDTYIGNGFVMTQSDPLRIADFLAESQKPGDGKGIPLAAQTLRRAIRAVLPSTMPETLAVQVATARSGGMEMYWKVAPHNVVNTSWTALRPYETYDFGYGLPIALRNAFHGVANATLVFPPAKVPGRAEGGLDLVMHIDAEDAERLLDDPALKTYAVRGASSMAEAREMASR